MAMDSRATSPTQADPRRTRPRRAMAAIVAAAALAPAIGLVATGTAAAHSGAPVTTPASGSTVAALPATVTITFGGRLMRVVEASVVDAKGVDHASSSRLDPRNAARVIIRTSRPARGPCTVRWKVLSEDGHSQSGSFAFRVRR